MQAESQIEFYDHNFSAPIMILETLSPNIMIVQKDHPWGGAVTNIGGLLYANGGAVPCE